VPYATPTPPAPKARFDEIDNNTSFKIDKNEISEVKKLSIEEATIYYQNNPDRFIPSFDKILKLINKKMKLFN